MEDRGYRSYEDETDAMLAGLRRAEHERESRLQKTLGTDGVEKRAWFLANKGRASEHFTPEDGNMTECAREGCYRPHELGSGLCYYDRKVREGLCEREQV